MQGPKELKSLITISLPPVHPGEVLLEDFMEPLSVSQNQVARAIGVSPRRINDIVHGRRAVTADTAARLSRYFGTSAEFWLNLQARYELDMLEETKAETLAAIVPLNAA
ncbi:HigA family addiction module antitoxin [Rothia sp. 11254D007CT]